MFVLSFCLFLRVLGIIIIVAAAAAAVVFVAVVAATAVMSLGGQNFTVFISFD